MLCCCLCLWVWSLTTLPSVRLTRMEAGIHVIDEPTHGIENPVSPWIKLLADVGNLERTTVWVSHNTQSLILAFSEVSYSRLVSNRNDNTTCLDHKPLPPPVSKASSPLSASSFSFEYLLFSLRSSSTCLRLLPRLRFYLSFSNTYHCIIDAKY